MRLPSLGGLARGTLAVLGWNIARLAAQLAWVVLMARSLGVDAYGTFSGIAGLALALSGFAGAGLGLRMYQDVAREPVMFGERWAQAARALAWSSLLLWLGFVVIGAVAFEEVPASLLAIIALAELVGTPMVVHVAFAYAAHGRVAQAAAAPVAMSLARVAAVLALPWVAEGADLHAYVMLHAVATIGTASAQWAWCKHRLAPKCDGTTLDANALREGVRLSSIWASGLALSSLDKAMALREGGAAVAGHYTAANRFASLMALPVDALVTAAMPRLFRAGAGQMVHPRLIAWLLAATLGYGLLAAGLLWVGAGWLPRLLGPDFAPAVPALGVLALYVPAYCLRSLGANILLGFGRVRWRLVSELGALVLMVALMVAWTPHGAVGAAWAVVIAEWCLVAALWVRLAVCSLSERGRAA